MRTPRSLAATALAAAALALSPALASAATAPGAAPGGIEVSPSPAPAGSTVNLTTTACGTNGTARINAYDLGRARLTSAGQTHAENVQGTLRIPRDATAGAHGITGRCADGTRLTGVIVVSTPGS